MLLIRKCAIRALKNKVKISRERRRGEHRLRIFERTSRKREAKIQRSARGGKKRETEERKKSAVRPHLAFVASATNLGLGTRKLPNAPASEFTSTTTATLTRTRATMWQHVPSVHICAVRSRARDMRRLGTHSTYLRRCGYIFYKTFLIPQRITRETRKG